MRSRWSLVGMVLALWSFSCGEDKVCLGHLDPIPPPSMRIQTNNGADAIVAVEIMQGPCRRQASYGWSDGAPGVNVVTIERSTGSGYAVGTGDPCTIELVSHDGRCTTVTATMEYHPGLSPIRHCRDNSNCCPES